MEVKMFIIIAVGIILSFFVGVWAGKSTKQTKYDGKLLIGTIEDRDQFQFIFTTELEDLQNQKELVMEIVQTRNTQNLQL